MRQNKYQKIVIRIPNWIGDAVMALPCIEKLRHHFPDATLIAWCQGSTAELLKNNPFVDEVLFFTRRERKKSVAAIKEKQCDLGILFPNSFSSAWLLWKAQVRRRVGFRSDFRRLFLTDSIPFPEKRGKEHLVETYLRLLAPLGISSSPTLPKLFVSKEEKIGASKLLMENGVSFKTPLIGINPGAAYGSAKCWPPERFKALIRLLQDKIPCQIVLFGDKAGKPLVDEICLDSPDVIHLAGKTTLRELISIIAQCTVFLTNDSGPMHIAAAIETPLIALFGSTNPIATGPYKKGLVIQKKVECSPCYLRTCPIDFRCMKNIQSEEVFLSIKNIIEAQEGDYRQKGAPSP